MSDLPKKAEMPGEEQPRGEITETTVTDDTLKLYLFGDLSDEDRVKFESTVAANPELFQRLQSMQEQFEKDWYAKKFTGDEKRKLKRLYVSTPRSQQKNTKADYLRGFLFSVVMSGDPRIQ